MFTHFDKLFRKNLNRSRLGCKNTTFKGFYAKELQDVLLHARGNIL